MVYVWEVEWWNGSEWENCEMYSEDNNSERVKDVFMSQMYDGEVCENVSVSPEGMVKNESHIPVI